MQEVVPFYFPLRRGAVHFTIQYLSQLRLVSFESIGVATWWNCVLYSMAVKLVGPRRGPRCHLFGLWIPNSWHFPVKCVWLKWTTRTISKKSQISNCCIRIVLAQKEVSQAAKMISLHSILNHSKRKYLDKEGVPTSSLSSKTCQRPIENKKK